MSGVSSELQILPGNDFTPESKQATNYNLWVRPTIGWNCVSEKFKESWDALDRATRFDGRESVPYILLTAFWITDLFCSLVLLIGAYSGAIGHKLQMEVKFILGVFVCTFLIVYHYFFLLASIGKFETQADDLELIQNTFADPSNPAFCPDRQTIFDFDIDITAMNEAKSKATGTLYLSFILIPIFICSLLWYLFNLIRFKSIDYRTGW